MTRPQAFRKALLRVHDGVTGSSKTLLIGHETGSFKTPYLKKQMDFYRQKRAAKAQNQIYVQEIMKNDSEGGER